MEHNLDYTMLFAEFDGSYIQVKVNVREKDGSNGYGNQFLNAIKDAALQSSINSPYKLTGYDVDCPDFSVAKQLAIQERSLERTKACMYDAIVEEAEEATKSMLRHMIKTKEEAVRELEEKFDALFKGDK